jgi:membrane carboxypeptidase/penicillin-binding protein PbpC
MKFTNEWNQIIKRIDEIKSENMEIEFCDNLFDLLVAGEDHRFWSHFGVDPIGLIRAFWKTTFCNRREGGSTIAMQLVRTITKRYEICPQRKIKEICLATRLTLTFDRKEILKLYLNIAYFGWNMHGIKQTCKALGLERGCLSNYEAASIVARLKYPEPRFNKDKKLKAINLRADYIINRYNLLNLKEKYGAV